MKRPIRRSGTAWQRRLLEYARFFAERSLCVDFFDQLFRMLASDFPDFIAIAVYDHNGRLVPDSSMSLMEDSVWKRYVQHYGSLNPFPRVVTRFGLEDRTVVFSDWIPADAFRRSAYYNEFMKELKTDHALGMSVGLPGVGRSTLSFYRGEKDGGDFTNDDVHRVEELRPFFRNALLTRNLWTANEEHRCSWRARLERLEAPAVTFDGRGAAQAANDVAESLLSLGRLPREGVTLVTHDAAEADDLPPGSAFRVFNTANRQFTPREKDVMDELLRGRSTREIALTLGITGNTVRTFLKSIYAKAGVHSSRQLIARFGARSR